MGMNQPARQKEDHTKGPTSTPSLLNTPMTRRGAIGSIAIATGALLTSAIALGKRERRNTPEIVFNAVNNFPKHGIEGASEIHVYPMPGSNECIVCIVNPYKNLHLRPMIELQEEEAKFFERADANTASILHDTSRHIPEPIRTLYCLGLPRDFDAKPRIANARAQVLEIAALQRKYAAAKPTEQQEADDAVQDAIQRAEDYRFLFTLVGRQTLGMALNGHLELRGIEDRDTWNRLIGLGDDPMDRATLAQYTALQQKRLGGIVETIGSAEPGVGRFPALAIGEDLYEKNGYSIGDAVNKYNTSHPKSPLSMIALSCAAPRNNGTPIARRG